jgi:hypothetical protein
LYARKQAFPGKEIYVKYQPEKISTFKLLFNYGYTEDYLHENNFVTINYGLEENDPQYIFKKFILDEESFIENKNFYLYSKYQYNDYFFNLIRFNCVSTNVFDYVKTLIEVASSRSEKSIKFKLKHMKYNEDKNVELCFLDKLHSLMTEIYNKFDSTYEQDLDYYQKNKNVLSENLKNIYFYRLSIKYIIDKHISFCNIMNELYKMNGEDVYAYLENNQTFKEEYHYYLEKYLFKL